MWVPLSSPWSRGLCCWVDCWLRLVASKLLLDDCWWWPPLLWWRWLWWWWWWLWWCAEDRCCGGGLGVWGGSGISVSTGKETEEPSLVNAGLDGLKIRFYEQLLQHLFKRGDTPSWFIGKGAHAKVKIRKSIRFFDSFIPPLSLSSNFIATDCIRHSRLRHPTDRQSDGSWGALAPFRCALFASLYLRSHYYSVIKANKFVTPQNCSSFVSGRNIKRKEMTSLFFRPAWWKNSEPWDENGKIGSQLARIIGDRFTRAQISLARGARRYGN